MTPISAALQKPTAQPDRDVASSQPEADAPNTPEAGTRGGFANALRAASGRPGESRSDTDKDQPAEPAQTAPETSATQVSSVDPANAAATILATILNAVAPTTPAAPVAASSADSKPGAAGPVAGGSTTEGSASAISTDASAPAATAGPGLGMTNAVDTGALQTNEAGTANTPPINAPKVAVLDSTVHFKPALPGAAPRESALSTLAIAAPISAGGAAPKPQVAQVGLPGLIDTKPQPTLPTAPSLTDAKPQPERTGLPGLVTAASPKAQVQIPLADQPQPPAALTDAATRAGGTGLEKADITGLADPRAVTGIARAGLTALGRPGKEKLDGPEGSADTGLNLPADALPTIAAAIKDELDRASGPEQASRLHQADPAVQTASDGPVRVLRIQLKPDDLGTVTVELRLANGQLETHLRASQPETAALLHRDAAILTDLLKQANYQADVTVGQARPSDTGGFSGGSASQGQPGFSDGGARPGQGGDRQRQADPGPAAGRREGDRGDETTRPRDSGIYL